MQQSFLLPSEPTDHLGISAAEAQPALQSEFYKELIGKLAWAIGSSYGRSYSNNRTMARLVAIMLARDLVAEHGYAPRIGYSA